MSRIRLAKPEDAPALAELNRVFNGPCIRPAAVAAKLRTGSEIVAIAVRDDAPVAFACGQLHDSFCYAKPYGELTELYVKDGFRRMGLATGLVRFMEKQFRQRGATHFHILTGIRNRPARALYEGLGYRSDSRRPEMLYERDATLDRRIG